MVAKRTLIIVLFIMLLSPLFSQEVISEEARGLFGVLSGSWEGDKGIGTVYLNGDGRGILTFNHDGEVTMELKIEVLGNRITVSQDEPNRYEFYSGVFPEPIARNITEKVRPMRWIFTLSDDWNSLDGEKETSYIKYDEFGDVINVDNSYSRVAVWKRLEGKVVRPLVNPAPGTYNDTLSIEIDCDTPGAAIFYTLNGSSPKLGRGRLYTGPFSIDTSSILKIGAFKEGWQQSDIVTGKYVIEEDGSDNRIVEFDNFTMEIVNTGFSRGNLSCSFRITNNLDSRWIGFQNARLFDSLGNDYWVKKEGVIRQDGWGGLNLAKGENTVFTLNFPITRRISQIKVIEIYLRDRGKIKFESIEVGPQ